MVAELVGGGPLPAHSPLLLRHSSLPFARLQIPNSLKTPKTPKTLQFLRSSCHPALWPPAFAAPGLQPALCLHIARGSFHQAPGCQRSSIAACPLPAHSILLLGHSSLPFARLQTPKTLKTPKTLQFPRGSCHQALWLQPALCLHNLAAASTKLLAVSVPAMQPALCPSAFAAPGLQPALCLHSPRGSFHQAPGRQRSGPLRAHRHLLLGHSRLPFARLQTLKTLKTTKTLQFPRGSCHQALWLQPALCLHSPRGSFHQVPGRQRSSIAACPLPAHSRLLLRHSSLPFARLQTPKTIKTPKTLKTLQFPRGSCH